MKTCPTCNRTYDDETFSFCTEDGILLSEWLDEPETVVRQKKFNSDSPLSNRSFITYSIKEIDFANANTSNFAKFMS